MDEIGFTQTRLATHFQKTPAAIQKWLSGARQPTLEEINQIADLLSVHRAWLTHGIKPEFVIKDTGSQASDTLVALNKLHQENQLLEEHWLALTALLRAFHPTKRTDL